MLKIIQTYAEIDQAQMNRIYREASEENAAYFHPDEKDLTAAIKAEEEKFANFLQKFFTDERNTYYVLEKDGVWVSALRLTKLDDFYYLEALETAPDCRRKGYAAELIKAVIDKLSEEGRVIIRDSVRKTNTASLATHKACGFTIEQENATNCLNGETNDRNYGLVWGR